MLRHWSTDGCSQHLRVLEAWCLLGAFCAPRDSGSVHGIGRSLYITGIKVYPQFIIAQSLGGGESAFDISCGLSGMTFEVLGGLDQIPLGSHCVCCLDN